MSRPEETAKHWRLFRLEGKVTEAKHLIFPKQIEGQSGFYFTARLDNQVATQFKSQSILASGSPFWAEDITFDSKVGFKDIKLVVWMETKKEGYTIVIPRTCLKSSEEQWYMLVDASYETKVTGSIQLQIKYLAAKLPRKSQGFSVNVVKAKELAKTGEPPTSFVVLHMLPDKEAMSTQHTHTQPRTNTPSFHETFFFTGGKSGNLKDLHCSVWSQLSTEILPTFLGHCSIPMAPVISKKTTNRWYSLTSISNDADLAATRKVTRKSTSEDERRNRPREFVKSLQESVECGPLTEKAHQWLDRAFALAPCSYCNNVLVGTQSLCGVCNIGVHHKCIEGVPKLCGGMGSIRLQLRLTQMTIMAVEHYRQFVILLSEQDYLLLNMLGRVSHHREDAAKCMINILNEKFGDFVESCVRQEILLSQDARTLFRANSMASKALDVYMKHVGTEYLKSTLEDVIKLILMSKKPFEMDPTRFDKKDSAETNAYNMRELNMIITDCIFGALKDVFEVIQSTVLERFPGNDNVKYTAVSGFVFLRFFTPAILGPALFGLKVGIQDTQTTRKLLLISKTLQNLSNLVEFGQKEPFMEPMNSFIISRIPKMKKFIDSISIERNDVRAISMPMLSQAREVIDESLVARDCADLGAMFLSSSEKLNGYVPQTDLLAKMYKTLGRIEAQIQDINDFEEIHDTGVETELDSTINLEEERKLLRMFLRCPSIDNLDSTNNPSVIGNYRNSADLKDEMIKGLPQAQIDFPIVSLSEEKLKSYQGESSFASIGTEKAVLSPKLYRLSLGLKKASDEQSVGRSESLLKLFESINKLGNSNSPSSEKDFELSTKVDLVSDLVLENSTSSSNISVSTPSPISIRKHTLSRSNHVSTFKSTIQALTLTIRDESDFILSLPSSPRVVSRVRMSHLKSNTDSGTASPQSTTPPQMNCFKCKFDIVDLAYTKVDLGPTHQVYHLNCLCCTQCDVQLTEYAFLWKERVSDGVFIDQIVCKDDYFRLSGFLCNTCNNPIIQDCIKINGKKYHATCRKCSICSNGLLGKEYTTLGNAVFCSDHKDVIPCSGCQKAIVGQVVQANDKFYHPDHFICFKCGKNLNGCTSYDHSDHSFCQWCFASIETSKDQSLTLLPLGSTEKDLDVGQAYMKSKQRNQSKTDLVDENSRSSRNSSHRRAIRMKNDAIDSVEKISKDTGEKMSSSERLASMKGKGMAFLRLH